MQYQFPVFENLCPSWAGVAHLGTVRRIPKGTVVLDLGATIDGVYFVGEGMLETVLLTYAGPEKVLYRVGKGCVFGEVCCFVGGRNEEVYVKALTDCTLTFFPRETIEGPIAREHPALLLEMVRILGHIVRMYGIHLHDGLNLDFLMRICRFLVYLVRFKAEDPSDLRGRVLVESGVTQGDVARLLGVHRVTVSKALKKLKDMGIILRFTRRELEISDFQRLYKLGEGGEARKAL